jgi:hypothetical protein
LASRVFASPASTFTSAFDFACLLVCLMALASFSPTSAPRLSRCLQTGSGSWRVPLDHLTRFAIHDFGTFSRLCGGLHSPLRFGKERRAYQSPALDVNLKYNVR